MTHKGSWTRPKGRGLSGDKLEVVELNKAIWEARNNPEEQAVLKLKLNKVKEKLYGNG